MRPIRRVHPFFWDLGATSTTEILVLASGVFVVSLFGRLLGPLALGQYLLLRRVVSWIQSGTQLGLGVALPRYVAQSYQRRELEPLTYFVGATLCLGVMAMAVLVILILGRREWAQLFFGTHQMSDLLLPLALLVVGLMAHAAVYGYYRGCLLMGRANTLQVINFGLVPLLSVVLLFRARSVGMIVSAMGICMFAFATAFAISLFVELFHSKLPPLRPFIGQLLQYGLARVPGEFAGAALFALGPVIAAHYSPLSNLSYLLLGLSLLMALSVSVSPLGLVLLSKVSMMLSANRNDEVRIRLEHLIASVLELSIFGGLQIIVFADVLVRAWVGARYLSGLPIIQITLLSVPFYLFFVAIRSAVDAASVVAHNAHNGYIALAVFVVLVFLTVEVAPQQFLLHGIAAALLAGNAVLAWRTTTVTRNLFDLRMPWKQCSIPCVLAVVLGFGSYAIHRWLLPQIGVLGFIGFEISMSTVFLLASLGLGSAWLPYFCRLLFGGLKQANV